MTKRNKESKKKSKNGGAPSSGSSGSASATKKRKRREVQVVVCPSAFPDFTTVGGSTSRRREQQQQQQRRGSSSAQPPSTDDKGESKLELDVQETIREVHKFGAEGFTGSQKKSHQNAEYNRVTGRTAKRQKIPTKILVGMRKKALKRDEREKQEIKESGVVSHHAAAAAASSSSQKKKKSRDRNKKEEEPKGIRGVFGSKKARNTGDRRNMSSRSFGPAPDVGFMKKGMLKVKQQSRR